MKNTLTPSFRIATANDLPDIINIINQAISHKHTIAYTQPLYTNSMTEWFSSHKEEQYPISIIECQGSPIGWYSFSPYRKGREALQYTAEVSYFLDYKYHNQGLGSKILQHTIKHAVKLKFKTLIAIVLESNTNSIKLLKKNNFSQWAFLPGVAEFAGERIAHIYFGLQL